MDKSLEVLQARRNELFRRIENDQHQMKELDKQIEAIGNGPVSAAKWLNNNYTVEPNIGGFGPTDMFESFKAGEANDRKRTQPLIDAAKGFMKFAEPNKLLPYNKSEAYFVAMDQALKTLEENE